MMKNQLIEKLLDKGRKHLSNKEHLSLIIGYGNNTDLEISENILNAIGHNLNDLGRLSYNELIKIKGVTTSKATAIISFMELGIRRHSTPMANKPQIIQSLDAYNIVRADLMDLPHEEFIVLLLNQANRVIDRTHISTGGLAGTVVDVKKIFRAVLCNPFIAGIVLAHNHPSDNLNPSKADIDITKKIKEAGKLLDISVLDHIIIAGNSYTSLADEGLI